jgi:hypothetical protein
MAAHQAPQTKIMVAEVHLPEVLIRMVAAEEAQAEARLVTLTKTKTIAEGHHPAVAPVPHPEAEDHPEAPQAAAAIKAVAGEHHPEVVALKYLRAIRVAVLAEVHHQVAALRAASKVPEVLPEEVREEEDKQNF